MLSFGGLVNGPLSQEHTTTTTKNEQHHTPKKVIMKRQKNIGVGIPGRNSRKRFSSFFSIRGFGIPSKIIHSEWGVVFFLSRAPTPILQPIIGACAFFTLPPLRGRGSTTKNSRSMVLLAAARAPTTLYRHSTRVTYGSLRLQFSDTPLHPLNL